MLGQRIRQIGKDSLVYGLGTILAKSLAFFLLPVYTRIFSPGEYGVIEMLTAVSGLLGAILNMGLDSTQSYYFTKERDSGMGGQARAVSAILQWRLSAGAALVVIATLISPLLNAWLFQQALDWSHFAAAFAGALCYQLMTQSAEVFRLLFKPLTYMRIVLAQGVVAAALSIGFVVVADLGVLGYFLGHVTGSALVAVWGWWLAREYVDWSRWHGDWWPQLLRFGAPLVPGALSLYVMNTADRWFVMNFVGQEALGHYGVAGRFALLLALAVVTFRRAWWPVALDAMHGEGGELLYRTVARLYVGLGAAAAVLLALLAPLLIRIFTAPEYHDAYPIVGVLAWGSLAYGFHLIAGAGMWKRERTRYYPLIDTGAALLNLILNLVLVPAFDALGAAAATSAALLSWNFATLAVGERLWPVGHHKVLLAGQLGLGVVTAGGIISLQSNGSGPLPQLALASSGVAVLAASSLSRHHWHTLYRRWSRR